MEGFGTIVDPETNQNVPVQSAVGQQVIKNYLECLKNGPDSKNILSTKMFYKSNSEKPVVKNNVSSSIKKIDLYENTKRLTSKQFDYNVLDQKQFYNKTSNALPNVNDIVWIKRSNGKWQLANVSNVSKNGVEVYFNNGSGKIGSKKGLGNSDILSVSAKVQKQFS